MMQTIRQCAWLIKYLMLPLTETILVELVVGYLIFKEVTYLPTILWMNLLTNPMLNVLLLLLVGIKGFPYWITVGVLEILIWWMEGWILYHQFKIKCCRGMKISFILNACSYMAGLFL